MRGAKPVRLPGGGLLLYVRVVAGFAPYRVVYPYGIDNPPTLRRSSFPQRALRPAGAPYQNALGAAPQDPLTLKLRLDTNDAKASSVQRRRYALKVPAAHFILDSAGSKLKIDLISVVASDATFA